VQRQPSLGVGFLRDPVDEFLGVRLAFFHRPGRAIAVRRLRYTAYPAELTQFSTGSRVKKRAILAKRLTLNAHSLPLNRRNRTGAHYE
jgi:hypothetical protein